MTSAAAQNGKPNQKKTPAVTQTHHVLSVKQTGLRPASTTFYLITRKPKTSTSEVTQNVSGAENPPATTAPMRVKNMQMQL